MTPGMPRPSSSLSERGEISSAASGKSFANTPREPIRPNPTAARRSLPVATPYSPAIFPYCSSEMSFIETRYLRASRSSNLRPISIACSRWCTASQCLILLRARELFVNVSQSREGACPVCVITSTTSPLCSL